MNLMLNESARERRIRVINLLRQKVLIARTWSPAFFDMGEALEEGPTIGGKGETKNAFDR